MRSNRMFTTSDEKKSSRGKSSHDHSGSETKKKRTKSRLKTQNNLALNLWDAYFQKPLESTIRTHQGGTTGKKIKVK